MEVMLDAARLGMVQEFKPGGRYYDGLYEVRESSRRALCRIGYWRRGPDQDRAFEAVALQDGFQMFERVARGKGMVGINPQSEDEAEAAAETAGSLDQKNLLPTGHAERQVTL